MNRAKKISRKFAEECRPHYVDTKEQLAAKRAGKARVVRGSLK